MQLGDGDIRTPAASLAGDRWRPRVDAEPGQGVGERGGDGELPLRDAVWLALCAAAVPGGKSSHSAPDSRLPGVTEGVRARPGDDTVTARGDLLGGQPIVQRRIKV